MMKPILQPPTGKRRETEREVLSAASSPAIPARWTFLTNHMHVLALLSQYPSIVLREVAIRVGITERGVQRIVQELEQEGFIVREKIGRQNNYRVIGDKHLRHPIEEHCSIQELLNLIGRRDGGRSKDPSES